MDTLPFDSLTLAEVNGGINDIDMALLNPARAVTIAGTTFERLGKNDLEDTLLKLKARRAILLGADPSPFMTNAISFYTLSGTRL